MVRQYKPYIPTDVSDLKDFLGAMVLESPTFVDKTGYFPGRNLKFVFYELNEGFRLMRKDLGEERYLQLMKMSARMRAHFQADPENRTDETLHGRELIDEMIELLIQSIRTSGRTSPS